MIEKPTRWRFKGQNEGVVCVKCRAPGRGEKKCIIHREISENDCFRDDPPRAQIRCNLLENNPFTCASRQEAVSLQVWRS